MKVIEQFLAGKVGIEEKCEDGIVVTENFVAVIDGATDKSGRRFQGVTGGRYAMLACAEAAAEFDADVTANTAVAQMTAAVAKHVPADLASEIRPTANVTIYSKMRREVWKIGDVSFWHAGLADELGQAEKFVDIVTSGMRAGILAAELLAGTPLERLREDDIGRSVIMPLLNRQGVFCNNLEAGKWAFAAVNGLPVPDELIGVYRIPDDVAELVLATDGFPFVMPTLVESEAKLQEALRLDPLCIGPLRSTKGLQLGDQSFDDRAYVRLSL